MNKCYIRTHLLPWLLPIRCKVLSTAENITMELHKQSLNIFHYFFDKPHPKFLNLV